MIDEQYVPEQVFEDLRVSVPSQSIFVVYLGLDCTAEEAGIVNETSFCRAVSDPTKMFANRFDVNVRTDHLSSVEITSKTEKKAARRKICSPRLCGQGNDARRVF